MQRCPDCGTKLPDNASFCASCGRALNTTTDKASKTDSKPQLPAVAEDAAPNRTPSTSPRELNLPAPPEKSEKKSTPPTSSREQNPPASAENVRVSGSREKTPRPARVEDIETHNTPALTLIEQTPRPAQIEAIEALNTVALPSMKQTPRPTAPEDVEALNTVAFPSVEKQKPAGAGNIEALNTVALPSMKQTPRPAQAGKIEEQRTIPVTAAQKPPRQGPREAYPRAQVYTDGTFVIYKGQQKVDNLPTTRLPATPAGRRRGLVLRVIFEVLARAKDPEPEKTRKPAPQTSLLGWLPILAVTSALGLFTVATAYNAARDNTPGSELYFWLGLGIVFLPALIRLILPNASRFERIGLLCTVAICLYLTKVSLSPLYFSQYDEFLHWRTVNDITSTGHLFTKNALLPVSPFYPGLEIVTNAFSTLSGLSTFQAGIVVVGMACLLMVLSLYLLCEQVTGSARIASIATIIYMTNQHFLFFDNQFAYESLALPLATFVIFAMTRYEMLNNSRPWILLAAWIALMAMILTHHLTNFVFEGLFLLWGVIYLFLRPLPLRKSIVIPTVVVGLVLTVITVLLIGNTVVTYFTSFFRDVGSEIAQALNSDGGGSRQLFANTGAQPTPLWERAISLGSVGLVTLSIPFCLLCFWRRYRHNTLIWVFAIIIIFYPVLQVLRLTNSGAEASDRASAFIFIAISFLVAVFIVQFWPVRWLNWKQPAFICGAIFILFMGGIILGNGIPPSFMPGPYEVSADARSVEPEGIQAALWARANLGPNNRMYTDRINQLLMSAYGEQYLVTKIGDNIDATDVFFDSTVSSYEIGLLQQGQIHYLAVDMRLSQGLPQDGFYFEAGEPGSNADTTPMNPQVLTKFDTIPQINRLFDSGNIVIYDTGGLINAPQKP